MEQETSELARAILTLEGLLYGISSDGIINQKELEKLKDWKSRHYEAIRHHPVSELLAIIDSFTHSHILKEEEVAFIRHFCTEFGASDENGSPLTCDTLRLQGYIQGILMDRKIYRAEILSLQKWLTRRPHLSELKEYGLILEWADLFLNRKELDSSRLYSLLENLDIMKAEERTIKNP